MKGRGLEGRLLLLKRERIEARICSDTLSGLSRKGYGVASVVIGQPLSSTSSATATRNVGRGN